MRRASGRPDSPSPIPPVSPAKEQKQISKLDACPNSQRRNRVRRNRVRTPAKGTCRAHTRTSTRTSAHASTRAPVSRKEQPLPSLHVVANSLRRSQTRVRMPAKYTLRTVRTHAHPNARARAHRSHVGKSSLFFHYILLSHCPLPSRRSGSPSSRIPDMTAAGCTVQESGSGKTTNPSSIEQYTMDDVEAPARTPSSIPNVDRASPASCWTRKTQAKPSTRTYERHAGQPPPTAVGGVLGQTGGTQQGAEQAETGSGETATRSAPNVRPTVVYVHSSRGTTVHTHLTIPPIRTSETG